MLLELMELLQEVKRGKRDKIKNLFALGIKLGLSRQDIQEFVRAATLLSQIEIQTYEQGAMMKVQVL